MNAIEVGAVFEVAYPFVRDTYDAFDGDEDGVGFTPVPSWKPGIRIEQLPPEGSSDPIADAVGRVIFTVISLHKPGKYPERVFYVRTWLDPEGKPFGKTKLRLTTLPVFKRLASGYGHEYRINDCAKCAALDWFERDHRGHAQEAA